MDCKQFVASKGTVIHEISNENTQSMQNLEENQNYDSKKSIKTNTKPFPKYKKKNFLNKSQSNQRLSKNYDLQTMSRTDQRATRNDARLKEIAKQYSFLTKSAKSKLLQHLNQTKLHDYSKYKKVKANNNSVIHHQAPQQQPLPNNFEEILMNDGEFKEPSSIHNHSLGHHHINSQYQQANRSFSML